MAVSGHPNGNDGVRHRGMASLDSMLSALGSAESKVKPSLSQLNASLGLGRWRNHKVAFSMLATVLFILVVVIIDSHVLHGRAAGLSQRAFFARRRLRVDDYPNVLVANSEPFKPDVKEIYSDTEAKSDDAYVDEDKLAREVSAETELDVPPAVDPKVEPSMRIIVLTMDRSASLQRLLQSLNRADYEGDRVDLDIWIDKSPKASVAESTMSKMLSIARSHNWTHGVRLIHKRTENAGLYEQWIYTWNVTDDTGESAVIMEDDLEVSPSFYKWLKDARQTYGTDPSIAAFSLQRAVLRAQQIKGVATGNLRIDKRHPVYKYRLLGTWGFSPQKAAWLEFRAWYEEMRRLGAKPYVDKLVTTNWYKSQEKNGIALTMWSQWFIKFSDVKNYFTLYANLPDGSTLASNWREGGMHYSHLPRRADFPVFKGPSSLFSFPSNPVHIDWSGLEIQREDFADQFLRHGDEKVQHERRAN